MEYLIKVGDKVAKSNPGHWRKWQCGQIIDKRPDGYYEGGLGNGNWGRHRFTFCVIRDNEEYWAARGSTDWKSIDPAVLNFKKDLVTAHQQGPLGFSDSFSGGFRKRPHYYAWDAQYEEPAEDVKLRKRDKFVDLKELLDEGHIDTVTFNAIFNPDVEHPDINLAFALSTSGLIKHMDQFERRPHAHSEVTR